MITVQERILEKAEELFKKYGVKSITMDEIATRLGISKKTIYQSFADKNELVLQIFTHHLCQNRDDCIAASETGQNAIHEVFLSLETYYATMQNINPNVMYDLEKYHPD
ncbi:MAG: TetR/AcrR family transcriptional regulator, partial [Bacteroidota bacterium]|nr:TetR/AcrR family transcriptional regulator [Bacteroidota bacterium]